MNIADELERLRSLRDSGALSEEEFARAKARVLGNDAGFTATGTDTSGAQCVLHQLRRSRTDRVLGGVCGGLGRYTGMPSWSWRVLFCLSVIGFGFGVLLYCLLWLFVPLET
ncbi:MAG: PspC domain-containing protein [Steroidobacteraceae bacterium]